MILKDIDMDLPYILDDKSYLTPEEIKEDYQKNWKWKRHNFNLLCRCMMAMISRLMPRIITDNFQKIIIECVEKNPKDGFVVVGGVCEVQVSFNLTNFLSMTSLEKKQYMVQKTREAIKKIKSSVDLSGVLEACDKVAEEKYENIWFWKKPKKNKNISVQIKVVHDLDFVFLYMVFTDLKSKAMEQHFLLKDKPSEWIFINYLGSLEWVDDKTAKLITKDEKEIIATCGIK